VKFGLHVKRELRRHEWVGFFLLGSEDG
jgi:hypothetical protein